MFGCALGAHGHHPSTDVDLAAVADPAFEAGVDATRFTRRACNGQTDQAVTMKVEGGFGASRQIDLTFTRLDHPGVFHLSAEQGHGAVILHAEGTVVAHQAFELDIESAAFGELAGLRFGDDPGAGQQSAGRDPGAGPKPDAVGVEQDHLAVGAEHAQHLRWVGTDHPVEGHRGAVRLLDVHLVVSANAELLPVDTGTRGTGIDLHVRAALADFALTGDDLTALGQFTGEYLLG
ncbi:hypothetical protein D3C79_664250 [compost metagenome]